MIARISAEAAPALGDLRRMGRGDTIRVAEDAHQRKDWSRYLDAMACAAGRWARIVPEGKP